MKKNLFLPLLLLVLPLSLAAQSGTGFEVVADDASKAVNVYYNGMQFTSYIYPHKLEKPVLYPLFNSNGTPLLRGFPLEPAYGERVDHPHHVGVWFNFGDVNGIDFWNNSSSVADKAKYGTIRHTGVTGTENGENSGKLAVTADWNDAQGKTLLKSETEYIFGAEGHFRTIEHVVKLTAVEAVTFTDNKEGLFAMRLDRPFEEPSEKAEIRIGMDGEPMEEPTVDNDGVNGRFRDSRGREAEAGIWGKQAEWVMASANREGDESTVAILDHKNNPGFPAHWHARGYGLFAANNMGSKSFNQDDEAFSLKLAAGESVTFRHKIIIKAGSYASDEEIQAEFDKFNK